jgi:hypothetical protein
MIDDVRPPERRQRPKPKVIEPLPKPDRPSIHELAKAEDPTFETPEQVAVHDTPAAAPIIGHHENGDNKAAKHPWYKLQRPLSRRQKIIGAVIIVVLAFGIGATWTLTHHKRAVIAQKPPKKATHKIVPQTIYSNLTGLPITDASLNSKPVTAVMVENSIDARPQSGLSQAGIVFEAVAEGGVTRFMALYQDTTPTNVGPIRSARPYYVQWAMGFDAAYAHVGGSPDALSDISSWGVKDMNQFSNGGSYHRVSSRPAPHNVYTGIDTLNQLESKKGFASTYTPLARKKQAASKAPTASSIDLKLSGYTYDPHYDYNAATNSYNRSEAGQAQTDANTNTQLSPKVVVAIVVPEKQGALDSSGAYYSDYNPIGSGTAYIFQDGAVTTGQWNKASNSGTLTFTDSTGKPLPLNPGQTWITAVTSTSGVIYK